MRRLESLLREDREDGPKLKGDGGCRGPVISGTWVALASLSAGSPFPRPPRPHGKGQNPWLGWKESAQELCFENLTPDSPVLGQLVGHLLTAVTFHF